MHQFREHHSEFEGFSDFFAREVFPVLQDRDAARKRAVRNGLVGGGIAALILGGIAAYILARFGQNFIGFLIGAGALLSPFVMFWVMTNDIREETKERIVGAIVGYIDWSFTINVPHVELSPFRDLFLLPKRADRTSFEDKLSGQAHGAAFQSVEAHLEVESKDSKGNSTWKTVFQGQLMTLDFPTKTFGRTIVLRDKGWFNPKKRADMKRIGLVDPVFEKAFEAYGTDQVEGRVILDPAFMQRIVDLEQTVSGKNIRFGFDQDRLYIAVETKDRYEAGSMFKALTDPKRTQKILDEVGAIYDIVDILLADSGRPALPY